MKAVSSFLTLQILNSEPALALRVGDHPFAKLVLNSNLYRHNKLIRCPSGL